MPGKQLFPCKMKELTNKFIETIKRDLNKFSEKLHSIINSIKSHRLIAFIITSFIIASLTCSPSHYLICIPVTTSLFVSIYLIFVEVPKAFNIKLSPSDIMLIINFLILFFESILLTFVISNDSSLVFYFINVVLRAVGVLSITMGILAFIMIIAIFPVLLPKLIASIRSITSLLRTTVIYPNYKDLLRDYLKLSALLVVVLLSILILLVTGIMEYLGVLLIINPSTQNTKFFIAFSLSLAVETYLVGIMDYLEKKKESKKNSHEVERYRKTIRYITVLLFSQAKIFLNLISLTIHIIYLVIIRKKIKMIRKHL